MPKHDPPATTMPEPWVLRASHRVAAGSSVIDLACGNGRHGRWFLANEHRVVFVDRDVAGVAELVGAQDATVVEADLEAAGLDPAAVLPADAFGGVVVVNYLWRPLLPAIISAVAPGGTLIYQTFAAGNERFGKPSNPDFLLASGELLEAVRGRLEVMAYEHGEGLVDRPAVVQRIVARRAG